MEKFVKVEILGSSSLKKSKAQLTTDLSNCLWLSKGLNHEYEGQVAVPI